MAALPSGCGNDNGGPVPDAGRTADAGNPGCTIPSTFTGLYDRVFHTTTCVLAGCHNAMATNGIANNLDMSGDKASVYDELLMEGTFAADVKRDIPSRIKPNDPTQSFLWHKIADTRPPGFGSRMPIGGILPQCELDTIRMWIESGARND